MFLERFNQVENFTITKLPLGGSKNVDFFKSYKGLKVNVEKA